MGRGRGRMLRNCQRLVEKKREIWQKFRAVDGVNEDSDKEYSIAC